MDWNAEAIERLRSLWTEGLPTAEIGRRLNISKNAVVGKAHRLALVARPSPIRRDPDAAPRPRQPMMRRLQGATLPPLSARPEAPPASASAAADPHQPALPCPALEQADQADGKFDQAASDFDTSAPDQTDLDQSGPDQSNSGKSELGHAGAEHFAFSQSRGRTPASVQSAAPHLLPVAEEPANADPAKPPINQDSSAMNAKSAPPPPLLLRPTEPARPVSRPVEVTLRPSQRNTACCWPIGEPGTPSFHFCGKSAATGRPYCEAHAEIAYVRVRDRRDNAA